MNICNGTTRKKVAHDNQIRNWTILVKPSQPMKEPRRSKGTTRQRTKAMDARVRSLLAIVIVTVILLNAATTVFVPSSKELFNQFFQVLMLVVGYYFGRN